LEEGDEERWEVHGLGDHSFFRLEVVIREGMFVLFCFWWERVYIDIIENMGTLGINVLMYCINQKELLCDGLRNRWGIILCDGQMSLY